MLDAIHFHNKDSLTYLAVVVYKNLLSFWIIDNRKFIIFIMITL